MVERGAKGGAPRRSRRRIILGVIAGVVAALIIAIVVVVQIRANDVQTRLDYISSLSPEDAQRYLEEHPEMIAELANAESAHTARWWRLATPAERKNLIATSPEITGALDGVPYGIRDYANRKVLDRLIARETANLKSDPDNGQARQTLEALKAIKTAINGKREVKRYLVLLVDDELPLAAVAVGNLDSAEQVTFSVPGMGTYTNDMSLWTQSAENLYLAQGKVGAPESRAVVAWLNYRTPPPGIDATLGAYATRGAPRLAADIQGLYATRQDDPVATVSVVGHSYGTTMAANAIADTDLRLFAFVMLGSAGIEERIAGAAALHADHVYAGEATADQEAQWGRISRTDPRSPSFGARVIQVDGNADEGLIGVTGHAPIIHSQWNDDPNSAAWAAYRDSNGVVDPNAYATHLQTWGYLDASTESLYNTAVATTRTPTSPFSTR